MPPPSYCQEDSYAQAAKNYHDMCYAVLDDVELAEATYEGGAVDWKRRADDGVYRTKLRWSSLLRFLFGCAIVAQGKASAVLHLPAVLPCGGSRGMSESVRVIEPASPTDLPRMPRAPSLETSLPTVLSRGMSESVRVFEPASPTERYLMAKLRQRILQVTTEGIICCEL